MLLALNAIRPDKNNNPPNAATIRKITSMAFDSSIVKLEAEEKILISVGTAAKTAATSNESRLQNIKQRLLIVVLYLPHLMSARHPARG